jgi:hypothetical protein
VKNEEYKNIKKKSELRLELKNGKNVVKGIINEKKDGKIVMKNVKIVKKKCDVVCNKINIKLNNPIKFIINKMDVESNNCLGY